MPAQSETESAGIFICAILTRTCLNARNLTKQNEHVAYHLNSDFVFVLLLIGGALPSRQLKLILAWCELHKDELMQNWELARDAKPLNHVEPLI